MLFATLLDTTLETMVDVAPIILVLFFFQAVYRKSFVGKDRLRQTDQATAFGSVFYLSRTGRKGPQS